MYDYRKKWLKRTGKRYYSLKSETGEALKGKSGIGRKYEKIALELLKGSIDMNGVNFTKSPHDIEWNGLKIDVKARNITKTEHGNCWVINKKKDSQTDYFLLFCLIDNKIIKILLLPADIFKVSLSIWKNSKYDKYKLFLKS